MELNIAQLGVSCDFRTPEKRIDLLATSHVKQLEISFNYLIDKDKNELIAFRNQLEERGISIWSIHSPFGKGVEISELDERLRYKSVAMQKQLLETAVLVGAKVIVLHPSNFVNENEAVLVKAQLLKSLSELVPLAEKMGITYGLENLLPGCILTAPNELVAVIEQFNSDALKITFDTGHALCCGNFEESFKTFKPHIAHFHIHDNDAKNDLHLQPGKGDLNWDLFSEIFSSMDFRNPVILECETWGKNTYKEMLEAFHKQLHFAPFQK